MIKQLFPVLVSVAILSGCQERSPSESTAPGRVNPGVSVKTENELPKAAPGEFQAILQITQDDKTATFYKDTDQSIYLTQDHAMGSKPLIDGRFEGKTYAEILAVLAPESPVPEALNHAEEKFTNIPSPSAPGAKVPAEGMTRSSPEAGPLAKTAGQWDTWFYDNYCPYRNFCYLNHADRPSEWIQSTHVKYSGFDVLVYQGSQISMRLLIDGSQKIQTTVLYGRVAELRGKSRSSWTCWTDPENLCGQTHRLEISEGTGSAWHFSGWFNY